MQLDYASTPQFTTTTYDHVYTSLLGVLAFIDVLMIGVFIWIMRTYAISQNVNDSN